MEPKQIGPNRGIEQPAASHEKSAFENDSNQVFERESFGHEQEPLPAQSAAPIDPSQIAIPSLPQPISQAADEPIAQASAAPIAANDDDLIEKEWVDHAKKIISETKDDPFKREQEISKLQIEYIKKRYGRIIGEVSE